MAFFDNIHFPYFSFQELNLDWLLKEVKRIAGFMPEGGNVGDILTRKSDGAEWEVPQAVAVEINTLPEDTQILDNDQLIFYDISAQANRKIKPPNLMDSMCSNGTPLMNGTGSAGTSKKPARYDHVHPTDTFLLGAINNKGRMYTTEPLTTFFNNVAADEFEVFSAASDMTGKLTSSNYSGLSYGFAVFHPNNNIVEVLIMATGASKIYVCRIASNGTVSYLRYVTVTDVTS